MGRGMRVGKFREVGRGFRELWEVEGGEIGIWNGLGKFNIVQTLESTQNTTWR